MESNNKLYLVSTVDRVLVVPKTKKRFPNEENLKFSFKAGIPQLVPDWLAVQYSKDYPEIFSIAESGTPKKNLSAPSSITQSPVKEQVDDNFDAKEFLNQSHPLTQSKLEERSDKELFAISKVLGMRVAFNIGKSRHIERILGEIEARNNTEPVLETDTVEAEA